MEVPVCGHAVGRADGELRERRQARNPPDVLGRQSERLPARGLGAHDELLGRLARRELDVAREERDAPAPVGAEVVRGREREGAALERDTGGAAGVSRKTRSCPLRRQHLRRRGLRLVEGEWFRLYVIDGHLPDAGGLVPTVRRLVEESRQREG